MVIKRLKEIKMHANYILDPIFHQVLDPCLNTSESPSGVAYVEYQLRINYACFEMSRNYFVLSPFQMLISVWAYCPNRM